MFHEENTLVIYTQTQFKITQEYFHFREQLTERLQFPMATGKLSKLERIFNITQYEVSLSLQPLVTEGTTDVDISLPAV